MEINEKEKKVVISRHFLERWRQRVCKQDNEKTIKEKVLTPEFERVLRVLGGKGAYPYGEVTIIVENYKFITCTCFQTKEERKQYKKEKRKKYGTGNE